MRCGSSPPETGLRVTARTDDSSARCPGLQCLVTVYGIEGPAWPALDTAGVFEFSARMPAALHCARLVETDPLLINASAHLLAVGTVGGSMLT